MNNSLSNPDPRTFPLKDLAAFCTGFIPSRIGAGDFEPTRADGRSRGLPTRVGRPRGDRGPRLASSLRQSPL